MSRPTTWVTDLRHYIDEETDDWAEDMLGPALNLALARLAMPALRSQRYDSRLAGHPLGSRNSRRGRPGDVDTLSVEGSERHLAR